MQRSRAAQVGFVMRSYRNAFHADDGRRGLTQEALLERMGLVDRDYAERYSHATVSRWESGKTRPTLQRLKVFGKALELSRTEVAGLILLAGIALDFPTALRLAAGRETGNAHGRQTADVHMSLFDDVEDARSQPFLRTTVRFWYSRVLPIAACIVGGYALSHFGWNNGWMPTAYVVLVVGLVLAQGFLLPDRDVQLREFFWTSIFFLLSTPLLQFSPLQMDHYGFYRIGHLYGTQMPYMYALLFNLLIASTAGLMFQYQWRRHYPEDGGRSSALRRGVWIAGPPMVFVYSVMVAISNISVSIQLAVLLPVLGAVFALLAVLRDPSFNPSKRDRIYLLSAASALGMLSTTLGVIAILLIYLSPNLPSVLPDHNLLHSWEINFSELGITREEALDRLNLGYMWHAIWVFAYMFFVVGGNLIVAFYRIGRDQR